jgi:hypothetical protein
LVFEDFFLENLARKLRVSLQYDKNNEYSTRKPGGKLLVAHLVEALRFKPGGREFDPRWYHWNVPLT